MAADRETKMSSVSSLRRKRLASEIEESGSIAILSCEHCLIRGLTCVAMSSSKSVKCANCARKGIKCVDVSWEILDKTREEAKSAIEESLEELSEVYAKQQQLNAKQQKLLAQLSRSRKILKIAESRAKAKAICLMDELEEEEEAERVRNGGHSDGELRELADNLAVFNQTIETREVSNASDSHDGIAIIQADS
ncbi:MAG: hypothetical protein QXU18_11635 [Thermoplasmatales archaeon]